MKRKFTIGLLLVIFIVLVACGNQDSGNKRDKDNDKKEKYRIVKVEQQNGDVEVLRQEEIKDPFKGMALIPKDVVTTKDDSGIVLRVDYDKHIVAEENTKFSINTSGNENEGKVTIDLEYGKGLFTIDNKLGDKSEFNVNTPNAALSVRGTIFEVIYNQETEETIVKVIEGTVWASNNNEEVTVEAGESIKITEEAIEPYEATDEEAAADDENGDDLAAAEEEDLSLYTVDGKYTSYIIDKDGNKRYLTSLGNNTFEFAPDGTLLTYNNYPVSYSGGEIVIDFGDDVVLTASSLEVLLAHSSPYNGIFAYEGIVSRVDPNSYSAYAGKSTEIIEYEYNSEGILVHYHNHFKEKGAYEEYEETLQAGYTFDNDGNGNISFAGIYDILEADGYGDLRGTQEKSFEIKDIKYNPDDNTLCCQYYNLPGVKIATYN